MQTTDSFRNFYQIKSKIIVFCIDATFSPLSDLHKLLVYAFFAACALMQTKMVRGFIADAKKETNLAECFITIFPHSNKI